MVRVTTPEDMRNNGVNMSLAPIATGTGVDVEIARSVAQTQAAMLLAFRNPRIERECWDRMKKTCGRLRFAERALFAYKRGHTLLIGPTIRMAEGIATAWRNLDAGFKVISKNENGYLVQAYCFDLEANLRIAREFFVSDKRYTGGGQLTSERDILENISSVAQRRVRSVILECLPTDYVDDAQAACYGTLRRGDGKPFSERVKNLVGAFWEIGINEAQLEDFLGHNLSALDPVQMPKLQAVYQSISSGMGQIKDFFKPELGQKNKGDVSRRTKHDEHVEQENKDEVDGSVDEETDGHQPPMTDEEKAAALAMEREEASRYDEEERAAIMGKQHGEEGEQGQMQLDGQQRGQSRRSRLKR